MNNTKTKLSLDSDGIISTMNVADTTFKGVPDLKGFKLVTPNRVILRPLPQEDVTLPSGITIPASAAEFKAVVVCAYKDSPYTKGDLVALDVNMFPNLWVDGRETKYKNIPTVFIEGEEVLISYESHIIGCYGQRIEE